MPRATRRRSPSSSSASFQRPASVSSAISATPGPATCEAPRYPDPVCPSGLWRVEIVVRTTAVDPVPCIEAIEPPDVADFEHEQDQEGDTDGEDHVPGTGTHGHRRNCPD